MTLSVEVHHCCPCGRPAPLCDIYVCAHCDKIACQLCVVKEIESTFCPSCLEVAREGVSAERGRCCRCADCPSCFSTLSIFTRSEAADAGRVSPTQSPPGQPFMYFRCENCLWQSAESGLVAPDAAALADELLRRERRLLGMPPDSGLRNAGAGADRSPLPPAGTPGQSPLLASQGLSPFPSTAGRAQPSPTWFAQRVAALAERLQEAAEPHEGDAVLFPPPREGRAGSGRGAGDQGLSLRGARLFSESPSETGSPAKRVPSAMEGRWGGGGGGGHRHGAVVAGDDRSPIAATDDVAAGEAVTDASGGVVVAVASREGGTAGVAGMDTGLQQRLRNPGAQPYDPRQLLPSRKPLRAKVAKRCEGCLRYLVKPDALPGSARFKLRDQSLAVKVLPTVTVHPRSAIRLGSVHSVLVLLFRNPLDREVDLMLAEDKGRRWQRIGGSKGGSAAAGVAELSGKDASGGHSFRLGPYSEVDDTDDDVHRAYRELESALAAANLDGMYPAGIDKPAGAGAPSRQEGGGEGQASEQVELQGGGEGQGRGGEPEDGGPLEAAAARGTGTGPGIQVLFRKGNLLVLAVPLAHADHLASLQWTFSLELKFSTTAKSNVQKVLAGTVVLECKGFAT